jgi:hypothetical protein
MTLKPSFLAFLIILGSLGAALADDWHDRDWHNGDWNEHDWHRWHEHWGGPGYGFPYGAPPPVVYASPPVYAPPPPVAYSPPVYYYPRRFGDDD